MCQIDNMFLGTQNMFCQFYFYWAGKIIQFFHYQVDGPPVEFGTVLVYSCLASCWGDDGGPREEIVIVQGETM